MAEQDVTDVCRIKVRPDGIYQSHWGPSGMCEKPAKCINCSGDHPANSNQCPNWEERKIIKIKGKNNILFPDTRKQYEQFYTGQIYASAVKPITCNQSTQTENKGTKTDDTITEYTKHKVPDKTQDKQKVLKEKVLPLHFQGQLLNQQP